MYKWNIIKENEEVIIKSKYKAHCLYKKQLMYFNEVTCQGKPV
jgi:hypothetical protein